MNRQSSLLALPALPASVHFVGVGGIGMSGLARILQAWGYRVSGSDSAASEITAALEAEGIPVNIGHTDVARAASADLLVMTAAVRAGNAEVDAAVAAGRPAVKRAELLGLLANARRCVAVAGSHGKSTTSGMLVTALMGLGADPSYAVGAVVGTAGTNAAPGAGPDMVVEADEYDHSFLWLTPDVAIVNNVEYDHPDIFADQHDYDAAFLAFIGNLRPGGSVILAADDSGVARLLARRDFPHRDRVVTFGETGDCDWRLAGSTQSYQVTGPGGTVDLTLAVPGRHNARNATAALALLAALGYDPAVAARALGEFQGVGRRFDLKGEAAGVVVVDDYAHHPSELIVTLRAAKERYPDRRIVAAFQPHTFSRTKALLAEFADALSLADVPVVLDIYPSRETDSLGISSADVLALMPERAIPGGSLDEALRTLDETAMPGDVVLTIGAGDVTKIGPRLLDLLAARGDRA